MTLSIVVAMALDRAIGRNNDLLWRLPADLKRFKSLTTGHSILMGRRTWESLPNGALPNRRNIVISRSLKEAPGAELFGSVEEALEAVGNQEEVFVIGGGEIYRQLLKRADRLYLTLVEAEYPDADTFFPEIDWVEWQSLYEEVYPADDKNPLASKYYVLSRAKR